MNEETSAAQETINQHISQCSKSHVNFKDGYCWACGLMKDLGFIPKLDGLFCRTCINKAGQETCDLGMKAWDSSAVKAAENQSVEQVTLLDEALRLLELFALSYYYRADYDQSFPIGDAGLFPTEADLGTAWKLLGITEKNYRERVEKVEVPYRKSMNRIIRQSVEKDEDL